MKQIKVGVLFLLPSCFFIILLLYYWQHLGLGFRQFPAITAQPLTSIRHHKVVPMKHINLDELYKDNKESEENFLNEYRTVYSINTPGCQIPFNMINYRKQIENEKKHKQKRSDCGKRAVHIKKIDGDRVRATVNPLVMKKYLRKSARFDCCYRFLQLRSGHENTKINFTLCVEFSSGATIFLQTDFINVRCVEYDVRNKTHPVYDDVFAFAKKMNTTHNQQSCNNSYNVLILGMDSMSLPRIVQTMPRTTDYLHKNFWFCFRGYHKVGDNTFPNVMATLTGHSMPIISSECQDQMDQCNKMLMWSKFQDIGYVTAYGEDFLRLPDTFSRRYAFQKPPTDHYIRPLFIKGEKELNNKSLVCAGKISAGQQLLDYAADFVTTYRNDRFFGFFWMNSFSHNTNSRPQDADRLLENFFNKITYTGILENTFVIFYSDHGIRFGPRRIELESYYDERLPFFFMRPPTMFKTRRWKEYKALADNQFKLVTPYDLFNTLMNIKELSTCKSMSDVSFSRGCPNCHSLFTPVKTSRTCRDAAIHDKWCSCHQLYPLDNNDVQGIKSVLLAVSHIKTLIKSIKTKHCWKCLDVSLKNVIRIHFYYDGRKDNIYYVVAFTTAPGNMSYEAVVNKSQLIGPLSVITPYKGQITCTRDIQELARARLYCTCEKIQNCT
ncbi:uncharacterized protein LOC134792763 [Cydia splendana]|uniref:uncharacterized protein LOC134792763 n=1 Tax=Cydia splendana TaxID=1100963 RepID=UPI0028F4C3F1